MSITTIEQIKEKAAALRDAISDFLDENGIDDEAGAARAGLDQETASFLFSAEEAVDDWLDDRDDEELPV